MRSWSAGAVVGYRHDVDLGFGLEEFRREMGGRAEAGIGVVELAGIGFCVGDQLGHGLRRKFRIDHEDIGL
jgi:hypothetical protein